MSTAPATFPLAPPRPAVRSEAALPRADEILPARRLRPRDRWGSGLRWPFGPVPTALSIGLHVVALVVILWALGTPPEPEGIGAQVYAVLTPDLGDLETCVPLDVPEELPEIEVLDIPTPELELVPEPEQEASLELLEELEARPAPSALSLSIVSKRVVRVKAAVDPTPPPPVPPVVAVREPVPPPRPRAAPAARPRGAMPRGRLRPIVKPITYPESARRAGVQGRARVAMTIDPQGSVVAAQILASSGHAVLDEAALASARRWRFAPPGTFRRAAQTFRFSLH